MALMIIKMKIIALTLIIGALMLMGANCTPNTSLNQYRCNVNDYSENDPYAGNFAYILADLTNVTPNSGYDYYTRSPGKDAICYGHGTCPSSLSYNDCADCLTAAKASVQDICGPKIGATVELVDCTIRYENYSF